ncbi:MAG: hypothetical protein WAL59_08165, partial [Roseiarcus sp.]
LDGADFLGANPLVGRPMRDETDRREWFVAFGAGAYVLRYVVEPEGESPSFAYGIAAKSAI